MSLHIGAEPGAIARTVLLPGDPLRARFIAERYLRDPLLVSSVRNMLYFTGTYRGQPVTVGASGMGCPSIGIYSYELYTEYNVETIIRIGTCGAYTTDLNLFDLVNADIACSESTFALHAWNSEDLTIPHQGKAYDLLNETATAQGRALRCCPVHSSDVFYRKAGGTPPLAVQTGCLAVEMEAFALFANARQLGRAAATLLTVSDVIPTHTFISPTEREQSLLPMIELALETAIRC